MVFSWSRTLLTLLPFGLPMALGAQAALDPTVAPRAAAMVRAGARGEATEFLGDYLATAPDDGAAWLQLGWVYLLDARDWHQAGHVGEPPAALLLDFAATAFDQSLRLPTDSSHLLRALVDFDRAEGVLEDEGWAALRVVSTQAPEEAPPAYVEEIGRNLVNSCPLGGVLVVGSDLEAVGVWSVLGPSGARPDLLLLLPDRYASDGLYRAAMAAALQVDSTLGPAAALAGAAQHRPVCLAPGADVSLTPPGAVRPLRLVRLSGAAGAAPSDPVSITEIANALYSRHGALAREVVGLYLMAARQNQSLCGSLLTPLGARQREVCGR